MSEAKIGSSDGLAVFVLSVGRDIGDEAGGEVVEALETAGFPIAGRDMVSPDQVDAAVARRLAERGAGALLVVGGASVPGHDMSTRAIGKRLAWAVPGLSEAFRALGLASLGADALLTELAGGVTAGRKLAFSLPDGAAAARLAADALIVPLLQRLPARFDQALAAAPQAEDDATVPAKAPRGAALPARVIDAEIEDEEAEIVPGVSVTEIKAPGPPKDDGEPKPASGWQAGLRALGAELKREWPTLPEALERLAPVRGLLDTAGQRGVVLTADGRRYAAFGFPDLSRDSSKVLLIREAEPLAEIIALHRHPRPVGLLIEGPAGALPSADEAAGPVAERTVGRAPPTPSGLWAVDVDAVYLRREGRIWRWDGKRETQEGLPNSTLASLMLRWSQK